MRQVLTVALLLLALVVHAGAGPFAQSRNASDDAAALREVREAWKRYFNEKDADAVIALYAEDATLVSEAGTFQGRAAIRPWVQASLDQGSVLESIEATRERQSGTLAYETGRSRRLVGPEVHLGQYLIVLEKIRGEWKIVEHCSMNVR
jgi:ketosteroid isomerase-like protein